MEGVRASESSALFYVYESTRARPLEVDVDAVRGLIIDSPNQSSNDSRAMEVELDCSCGSSVQPCVHAAAVICWAKERSPASWVARQGQWIFSLERSTDHLRVRVRRGLQIEGEITWVDAPLVDVHLSYSNAPLVSADQLSACAELGRDKERWRTWKELRAWAKEVRVPVFMDGKHWRLQACDGASESAQIWDIESEPWLRIYESAALLADAPLRLHIGFLSQQELMSVRVEQDQNSKAYRQFQNRLRLPVPGRAMQIRGDAIQPWLQELISCRDEWRKFRNTQLSRGLEVHDIIISGINPELQLRPTDVRVNVNKKNTPQVLESLESREGEVDSHGVSWESVVQAVGQGRDRLWGSQAFFELTPERLQQIREAHFAQSIFPADVQARFPELYDYQKTGVQWLLSMRGASHGALLADDMGLGKTMQSLAMLQAGDIVLLVVPLSVRSHWCRQLTRYWPAFQLIEFSGESFVLPSGGLSEGTVVITNPAMLLRHREKFLQPLWSVVLVDEIHLFKNAKSAGAEILRSLRRRFMLGLTGTPFENRAEELESIFVTLGIGAPLQESGQFLHHLKKIYQTYALRRTKSQVLGALPKKLISTAVVELLAEEKNNYEHLQKDAQGWLRSSVDWTRDHQIEAFVRLLRLRQAACALSLINEATTAPSAKLEFALEWMGRIPSGEKFVVFSQWTGFLDLLDQALMQSGEKSLFRFDGKTLNRDKNLESFRNASETCGLAVSLKSGGVGIDLTAANHALFLDPWWNPAAEAQAMDRLDRIGQTRPVFITRLIADNTIESYVEQLRDRKAEALSSFLDDADAPQMNLHLSREEICVLLSL